jgi:hypothetical protein
MEHDLDSIEVILRTVLAYISLMAATKVLGKQTVAMMNFFEFATAISVGSIAANFSFNLNLNKWNMLINLAAFTAISFGLSWLFLKAVGYGEIGGPSDGLHRRRQDVGGQHEKIGLLRRLFEATVAPAGMV